MGFLRNLLNKGSKDKLVLKYDKDDKNWTVQKAGSILYLGTKEQCNKYLKHHQYTSIA